MNTRKKVVSLDKLSDKMKHLIQSKLDPAVDIVFCEQESDKDIHLSSADVLITFTKGISKAWLEQAAQCRFIQKLGAGVNNIDLETAARKGIPVSNTKGQNARSVAEHAVLLMMSVYKHIITAHNEMVLNGKWLKTELRDRSYELSQKKVGLVGFGAIGKEVANLLRGFQCEIRYYDVNRLSDEQETKTNVSFMEFEPLLAESDVISLHVPFNQHTYHLINEENLKLMKPTAILINTCRGGIVDEQALYQSLKNRQILGAGLDVFENEPLEQNDLLTTLNNVVLTPHIGGGTVEAMENVVDKACRNINHFLLSGTPYDEADVVNLSTLKLSGNQQKW
ncbi:2-hydroxyacid dehydrogenase [Paenibacillus naphthalenovorans]|uniref:2-hydroxyacid dehydrogenase n=1 Tax=Paenibacillus naphthalenovorans TaxID=162209 RepID=UPI0008870D26|nr:2-hydroxyacid dehydrogenase [Paenibacillus naphthalenovorans]SDI83548.1 D-3-phosphoglycerate dehydrogenase [Paenibacillus naphthalenovorans]